MFLPPLEYPFFPGKFCCRSERAKKAAKSVASQFHGLSEDPTAYLTETVGCFPCIGMEQKKG